MTNDELNAALYERMAAEQERYKAWLLKQSPGEILDHCYEYTIREDIVMAMEEHEKKNRERAGAPDYTIYSLDYENEDEDVLFPCAPMQAQ